MTATMHSQVRLLRTRAGSGCLNDLALRARVDTVVARQEAGHLAAFAAEEILARLLRQSDQDLRSLQAQRLQAKKGRKARHGARF